MASVANSMLTFSPNSSVMRDKPIAEDDVMFRTPLTAARASSRGAVTLVWTISGGTPDQDAWTLTCG